MTRWWQRGLVGLVGTLFSALLIHTSDRLTVSDSRWNDLKSL